MLTVKIEVSARHCHLSREDFKILFGEGAEITKFKELSQTGQFATNEFIDILNDEKIIRNVRVLGPVREQTQVELSKTEARSLAIDPPIKECTSATKEENANVGLRGPAGEIERPAAICAFRHLHTDPKTAKQHNFQEGQLVSVRVAGRRALIFENVLVRINQNFVWRMHLDTDEANGADLLGGETGEIIKN